jgi:high affinity sulfate transporter 1
VAAVDPRDWSVPEAGGIRRYVPILTWLPADDRSFLRFDTIAGATIWGLLVPEMIAYAGLAGLPPQAGLYTLLASLAAYAIFGTSRHLVAAGTSASAVLLASTVGGLAHATASGYAVDAATLILFVAGLFLLAGALRLGFIAQFLSRPVMEGFVFGLAIFVTVKQLPKLFGIESGDGNTIRQLGHLLAHLDETSGATLAVGIGALVLLFAGERWFPRVPGGLLALVLGIGVSAAFSLSQHGVAVVGAIPSGLPSFSVPHPPSSHLGTLLAGAAGMLLVVYSESLGAAQNFALKHGYEIDANQELIALGVANLGSGVIGGLPAGGSLSQSAVNDGAGARSEVSPLVATVLAIVTVLFLTPVFKNLPEAVLAALIIHAVSHLWKIAEFGVYRREQRLEFWIGLATLAGVLTIDVLPGLVIGIVSMILLVAYQASRPHVSVLGRVPGVRNAWGDAERHPDYERVPGVLVLRLEAPLFYANASLVADAVKWLIGESEPLPRAVVLDFGPNGHLDITSSEKLVELVQSLHSAGIDFALAEMRKPAMEAARRSGVLAAVGEDHFFHTIDEALAGLARADPVDTPVS